MTSRAEFLQRRRGGIGGSDIGAILGVDQYRDALDVYLEKRDLNEEQEENEAMIRGRYLEPVVSQLYLDRTGRKLRNGKFRRHRKHTLMIGHPDRIIVAKDEHSEGRDAVGVLECKTANRWAMRKFKDKGLPDSYVLQLQHYLAITGCKWGALAILCPDPFEFIQFEMDFDEALYNRVAEKCTAWWHEHVGAKIPPTPVQIQYDDTPPPKDGEYVEERTDDAWALAAANYEQANELRVNGVALEKLAKQQLTELVESRPGVYEGAGIKMYHRESKGRKTLDRRSLDAMGPVDPITMATLLVEAGFGPAEIEVLLEAAKLDLTRFDKIGKPFMTTRVYERTTT